LIDAPDKSQNCVALLTESFEAPDQRASAFVRITSASGALWKELQSLFNGGVVVRLMF
jgi:hypothetical protein